MGHHEASSIKTGWYSGLESQYRSSRNPALLKMQDIVL
jgi:hypothetical protein